MGRLPSKWSSVSSVSTFGRLAGCHGGAALPFSGPKTVLYRASWLLLLGLVGNGSNTGDSYREQNPVANAFSELTFAIRLRIGGLPADDAIRHASNTELTDCSD